LQGKTQGTRPGPDPGLARARASGAADAFVARWQFQTKFKKLQRTFKSYPQNF